MKVSTLDTGEKRKEVHEVPDIYMFGALVEAAAGHARWILASVWKELLTSWLGAKLCRIPSELSKQSLSL